jgi:F420-non-reducing hydrogenase large subunit
MTQASTIKISPITRIEGHASIGIRLDDNGNVADSKVHFQSIRGFEKFVEGKPAEEIPRIVTRICGIIIWHPTRRWTGASASRPHLPAINSGS